MNALELDVDDGAYSYAHIDPVILSVVLSRKYEEWMSSNKLVVNPDKTNLMVMETTKSAALWVDFHSIHNKEEEEKLNVF